MSISSADLEKAVTLTIKDYVGIITLNLEKKLNALTQQHYGRIAELLAELAANPETYVTVITGKGRFFSAGADVTSPRQVNGDLSARQFWLQSFVSNNFYNTHTWYTHPKILIAALNGPAVGISAAQIAHCDFIYAAPHTFLLTPFSSLGLVAEGGASRAFVNRMGLSLANEALLMSKKIPVEDLLRTGFVNKVFPDGGGDKNNGKGIDTDKFMKAVLQEIDDRLGRHLNTESILKIKAMIRKAEMDNMDKAGVAEVLGGLEVFMKGIPQEEFRKIASGEKRHKL